MLLLQSHGVEGVVPPRELVVGLADEDCHVVLYWRKKWKMVRRMVKMVVVEDGGEEGEDGGSGRWWGGG